MTDYELLCSFKEALGKADYYREKVHGGLLAGAANDKQFCEWASKRQEQIAVCTRILEVAQERSHELSDAMLAILLEYELPGVPASQNAFMASLLPGGHESLRKRLQAHGLSPLLPTAVSGGRISPMKHYPARFEPEAGGAYSVTFRDIPEAITQGETLAEAREMAADALRTAFEFYAEDGRPVPEPSALQAGEELVAPAEP